jgi:hypothetical protein
VARALEGKAALLRGNPLSIDSRVSCILSPWLETFVPMQGIEGVETLVCGKRRSFVNSGKSLKEIPKKSVSLKPILFWSGGSMAK